MSLREDLEQLLPYGDWFAFVAYFLFTLERELAIGSASGVGIY